VCSRQWGLLTCWALLVLGLLVVQTARAQPSSPSEFRFEHLSVDEGLAHSDAMTVTQDKTGFIWVGTNHGLDRYDGYGLKQYSLPVNSLNGLSANRIRALHCDPAGQLWVGTERGGISFYDADHDCFRSFATKPVPPPARQLMRQLAQADVSSLVSDARGRLWVGTSQGLFVLTFGPGHQQLQNLALIPPAGAPNLAFNVRALAIDQQGSIWVGAYDVGLQVVDATAAQLVARATPVATSSVRALCLDHRGDLWVGTDHTVLWVHGAAGRRPEELTATALPQRLPFLQSLHLDSFNRLWAGTIYGLYMWEPGPATANSPPLQPEPPHRFLPRDGEPHSINAEQVYQIFEDRNQLLWLCSAAGGLNWINLQQKPFGRIRQQLVGQSTLPNNYVNTIYKEEARNLLWYGTRNGAACYDLTTKHFRYYFNQAQPDASGVDVSTIFQSSNGTLWFGTRGSGLVALTRPNGHDQLTTYTTVGQGALDLSRLSIESLAEDRYGTLWIGARGGGLHHLSQDGRLLPAHSPSRHPLPTSQFTYLLYDRTQDVLWASTCDAGLLKLRVTPDSVVVLRQFAYHSPPGQRLQVNYTWPLLLDRQGTLWIGTIGGGLHQLVTDTRGKETVRSYQQWLPESDVESLLADDDGNLWVGGTGLYRFRPSTRQSLRYDVSDGLQSNSFKIGAAYRAQDGTLYFGGKNGISYFQPRAIQPNPYPPVVQLTGLRISNEPVEVGARLHGRVLLQHALTTPQQLTIKASENDFSVDFVALNFASPHKSRYAYFLEGYHHAWVLPPPGQRTASFANLPPGNYTLWVKASNGEGGWSRQPATMQFTVLAPWYRTGWAYLLYALAALGAVAVYRQVEMAQQRLKSQLVLEQFQAEKDKELTDLKLGFFTNVSHELRTPLTLILGPIEEIMGSTGPVANLAGKVQLMHQQARKLLELVNQLLDFRKVETGHVPLLVRHDDVVSFLTSLYPVFRLRAEEKIITYVLDVPAEPVQLYFDRSKLEIILNNLLANAFTYTPAQGRVELAATIVGNPGGEAVYSSTHLTGNYLKVTVTDTGVGIKASELARIFDPYYQASHTAARRVAGTGIGLSLAKQFAERHGGQLTVASQQGVGTTFELRLPFGCQHLDPEDLPLPDSTVELAPEVPAGLPLSKLAVAGRATPTPASRPRLLLVEDTDDVRQYLSQLFADDYEVFTAVDGLVGWEQSLRHLPDLIISDVMMPQSDGLELCRQLKQHPKTAHIPVMLLTARTAAVHELEGLGVGADDYVSKPFNPLVLQAKAATLLRNRGKLREYYQRQILLEPTEVVVADADRQFLENAMAVVERNLDNPEFSVQGLAREVGMSQSIFYRRIKSATGQTTVEFIRDVRMKRAAQLLTQTQMRVSEVAFQVGIADEKYFRKTFQKIYGVVPSEYIRQHRPGRDLPAPATD
jgi:signal transduction histidine kinase/ligand-binding sensor domain-containing protein/DNA-binding response OmpR family regulator